MKVLKTSNTLIVIPARLASTRLPNKPLLKIKDDPMIVHVWRRAIEADIGPVIVACDGPEIADVIKQAGGQAIITDPDLPSGTDRVAAAVRVFDPDEKYRYIINLQGDLPFISPTIIQDIPKDLYTTVAAPIVKINDVLSPNVVKVVFYSYVGDPLKRAIYFSRQAIPYQAPVYYKHIGVYCYDRCFLEAFVSIGPTQLEMIEGLEQLRAIEHGVDLEVIIVNEAPRSVDTQEDLDELNKGVDIPIQDHSIVIKTQKDTLETILSQVTEENLHDESFPNDKPEGNEEW